jgi:uncharacterized membrane protein
MSIKAAITVNRPRDEVERLWRSADHKPHGLDDATVNFKDAPGDRGTEIHVELHPPAPGGKLGEVVEKVAGAVPRAKVKDELRHFKQRVETGIIVRSEGSPEGEQFARKLKQRPAQPLPEDDLQKVGAR